MKISVSDALVDRLLMTCSLAILDKTALLVDSIDRHLEYDHAVFTVKKMKRGICP